MPCFHPLKCAKIPDSTTPSGVRISFKTAHIRDSEYEQLEVPCGKCIGCRLEHSRKWAMRCVYEAKMHAENCFITLTYAKEHLQSQNLVKRDLTLFLKRMRKRLGQFRYFACGEYGSKGYRPHFHVIVFGLSFKDIQRKARFDEDGNFRGHVYWSPTLQEIWTKGFASVGDCTFESCAYVARYTLKKSTRKYADTMLEFEKRGIVVPEYICMSRRPGIGGTFFEKYMGDIYPSDTCFARGVPCKPPRYFDKLLDKVDYYLMDYVKDVRKAYAMANKDSAERLETKEEFLEEKTARNARRMLD